MDVLVATDFFTTEVWTWCGLVTYYILFFIHLESRQVHIAGVTSHPHEPWMMQMARQGKRIWKLRGFSVTVAASFTARSLLHYWRTLHGYARACLVSGAFCHVD